MLGATIVNRWFITNRGLMMGLFSASAATGTLIFQPGLAKLGAIGGWQWIVAAVAHGLRRADPLCPFLGAGSAAAISACGPMALQQSTPIAPVPPQKGLFDASVGALMRASKTRDLLVSVRHLLHLRLHHQRPCRHASGRLLRRPGHSRGAGAGLMAMMGVFDLFGTTLSGWLTDRFDPRKLLFFYYGLRGLSLIYLPFSDFSIYSLSIFARFLRPRLDRDRAADPAPYKRSLRRYATRRVMFGWIAAGHQVGAASAAAMAGYLRVMQGSYVEAFIISGMTGIIAALIALLIARKRAEVALA